MKIIFMGTADFSTTVLKRLCGTHHEIVAVVCQPDKKVGRKQILTPPSVKVFASEKGIKVLQFEKIKNEGFDELSKLNADVIVTASYGQILPKSILELTKFGTINVHASLLPKYRGACPIQWCLINGEKVTGVTIMKSDVGIDTGKMLIQEELKISDEDNATSLFEKLAILGGELLVKGLNLIETGNAHFVEQNHEKMTYYPMFKKEDGKLDFNDTAKNLVNKIRGMEIWPVCFANLGNDTLKIYSAEFVESNEFENYKNGEVVFCSAKQGALIKCGKGLLKPLIVQISGGTKQDIKSLINGKKLSLGSILE